MGFGFLDSLLSQRRRDERDLEWLAPDHDRFELAQIQICWDLVVLVSDITFESAQVHRAGNIHSNGDRHGVNRKKVDMQLGSVVHFKILQAENL